MSESMQGLKRTHYCTQVGVDHIGERVTVMGWAQRKRNLGSLIFVTLRDRTGILQVVFDSSKNEELFMKAEGIKSEYVLAVRGLVIPRTPENINPGMVTGRIEVEAEELRILNTAETPPLVIDGDANESELLKLRYRYLDLRRPDRQRDITLRHRVTKIARDYFDSKGFLEIETPTLTKSTPEGARDYLVPSRVHPGKFYALPQSPQLFKQLLMISGFDRYMQIAKCYRDEDLRADRQPEFTQIDLEMSFVDVDDVIEVNEGFLKRLFKEVLGVDVETPFPRMPYREAMERFGSDKPDLRFGLELVNVSREVKNCGFKVFSDTVARGGSVRALNAAGCAGKFSRKDIDGFTELVKTYGAKGLAWMEVGEDGVRASFAKFLSDEELKAILAKAEAKAGDLVFFVADTDEVALVSLGQLRLELGRRLNLMKKDEFKFLWVTEFPMFEYNREEGRWEAKHHPFTSPMDEDVKYLDRDPARVRAKAYDIILNGTEIGGGSIRIHSREMQSKIFERIGFSQKEAWKRFGFLLEAFRYGAPPHGGIAYGLDRLVMLIAGRNSIRDVIAFPKLQNATCPLTSAPDTVEASQLKELCIKVEE